MLTQTRLGRYLIWRAPTADDHHRFPHEVAGGAAGKALPDAPRPIDAAGIYVPGFGSWPGGMLAALLAATETLGFLALHDGAVACRWFAAGQDANTVNRNLSVSKSIAWALVGQAVADGHLPGADAALGDVLPGLADAGVGRLTLAQLMRMGSGIRYREGRLPWSDNVRVYHGARLRDTVPRVRLADPVDRLFHYNDYHPLLIALALEQATGRRIAALLQGGLWGRLAAGPATVTTDRPGPLGLAHLESGVNTTVEGLARFGQMILERGRWNGQAVLQEDWVARLDDLSDAWRRPEDFAYYRDRPWGRPLSSGRHAYKDFWWHHCPGGGIHNVFAMGLLGAHVYVARDLGCVLVRQARRFPPGIWWAPKLRAVAERVAAR